MKHSLVKLLSLALALLLCLATAAFAEEASDVLPSDKPMDLEVKIGTKIFCFSDTVEGAKEQGIRFESDDLKPGYYYNANNGRVPFKVLIDAYDRDGENPGPSYVCGYKLDAAEAPKAVLPHGVVLGEATRKSIIEAFGTPKGEYSDYLSYQFQRSYVSAYFYFDGEGEDAPLTRMEMSSSIGLRFGMGVSDLAGVSQDGIPDPTEFSFDQFVLDGKFYEGKVPLKTLLDNGWRLDLADTGEKLEPRREGSIFINLTSLTLFNGIGMMRAYVYNDSTAEPCDVVDAIVGSMGVNIADETGIVLADGITNGSSFDDVVATYGTNYDERDEDDYKSYTFSMGSSVKTKFNVIDNTVIYIEIQTGI